MAYLYLNFEENLQTGSDNWKDFYAESLQVQYEKLKAKFDGLGPETLQEFIQSALVPQVQNTFHISVPGFDRRIKKNKRDKQCIYNIVIRLAHNCYIDYVIPEKYDLILVGDLAFESVTAVTIKGIDLIDADVQKFGEKEIECTALCAFTKKTVRNRITGQTFEAPDYGDYVDLHNAVLTNDFIKKLCTECYPVPRPEQAIRTLEEWGKYISFRKYYLAKQSERCEEIDDVAVCDAYILTQEAYRRNRDRLSVFLLDGVTDFGKGEQVIINREESGAESFPLIRVDIRKNRKTVLSDTIGKGGKEKPRFEVQLRRYTNEAMGLSDVQPNYDENGNIPKGYRFYQYLLGERYLFTYVDEEPDCSALEQQYEKAMKEKFAQIDVKHASVISAELKRYMASVAPDLEKKYQSLYAHYEQELAAALEREIAENADKEIQRKYEQEVVAPIRANYERRRTELEKQLKRCKDNRSDEADGLRKAILFARADFDKQLLEVQRRTPISSYYVDRNQRLKEEKKKSLAISKQAEADRLRREKQSNLERQYQPSIVAEKAEAEEILKRQLAASKASKIENETIRCYKIYFRPDNEFDRLKDIQKKIEELDPKYLTYDNRAEKAKIERQEKALKSINEGYVRNPFLPTYLFAPESLRSNLPVAEEIDWYLESLNERQKLAVKRALASESLFLLQGPPGTGKTQVIAELTAQFAKRGKKVLISSETHKAIDNVFERLPKIPEIRPLRLIPTQNKKETNYSPEKLVDNFYNNIADTLERQIGRYEHYEETKATFGEEMSRLRSEYDRLLRLRRQNTLLESERSDLNAAINRQNVEYETLRGNLSLAKEQTELWRRTKRNIENLNFSSDDVDAPTIALFSENCKKLCGAFAFLQGVDIRKIGEIARLELAAVRQEVSELLSDDKIAELQVKKNQIKVLIADLLGEDGEIPQGNEAYKKLQRELIQVNNEIKRIKEGGGFDASESSVLKLFPIVGTDKTVLNNLPQDIAVFQTKLRGIINDITAAVDEKITRCEKDEAVIEQKILEKQAQISSSKRKYEELSENASLEEYGDLNSSLKQRIARFFRDFGIVREYDPSNLETAFDIIAEEWRKLEYDHKRTEAEDKKKIPVYREIAKYLRQDDILEEDRREYTRDLYECVNVFGLTCTSRDRFTDAQLDELGKYGINSVDIRTQGIDVVIVDEVSKSSFLDLLIPILYGKTVILVGDHRQLPPMYDLRHMRDGDFEGLDEDIINKDINERYTRLYEECFFKTLYEKVPEDFRVMLNRQYRCHSHIMEVFNHFYGGGKNGLIVGTKQQDNEKEHNLTVKIDGVTIIDPAHHIYFIDCDQKESSAYEGSTSKINEQEAEVAITLLKALNAACEERITAHKIRIDKAKGIDERPSAGIICTYGDQAGHIKKKRKYQIFNGFSEKQDERLIISTVDDFQGDERDIIIVSMVRNPSGARYDAEFIKKFERINVALSRARKLLIILGSRKFLTETGVIDLPDLSGNRDKMNFPVFREIIQTIDFRGRVWRADDILGE